MDPYLETHWGDVHHSFMTYARDQIRGRLPHDLRARLEESVYVQPLQGAGRVIVPDIRILEHQRKRAVRTADEGALAVAEPLIVETSESITQGHIEIRDRSADSKLVTVIEVLSLANKLPGEGQHKYRKKQQELRDAQVSLVELDLLRAGQRVLPFAETRLPRVHRKSYLACVRRGWEATAVEVYPMSLRERLPVIRIPLRATDDDIPLDLQPLIDQCYRNGDYDADINYDETAEPPLKGADARWADSLLRNAGRRGR